MPQAWWTLLCCLWLGLCLLPKPGLARSWPQASDAAGAQQQVWGASMQGYVVQGCLHTVSATTQVSVPPCRALVLTGDAPPRLAGFAEDTARLLTLAAGDGTVWMAGRLTPAETPAGWTCAPGQHYCWRLAATKPLIPPGLVLLSQSTVASGAVTEVGDHRPDSPVPGAPVNLMAPLFGATGDCATDDTAAIAAWYANAHWRKRTAYAPQPPGNCYTFTRWALMYDAQWGARLSQTPITYGEMMVYGDGPMDTADMNNAHYHGTLFLSSDPTGPAVFGNTAADSSNPWRQYEMHSFSVACTNTTQCLSFKGLNSNSALHNLTVFQSGPSGGGMLIEDTFLLNLSRMFVSHTLDSTAATGIGIIIRNTTRAGGIVNIDNVSARGWLGGTGWELGHADLSTATQINNVYSQGLQAIRNKLGLLVGGGIAGSTFNTVHIEGSTERGMLLKNNSRAIAIVGGFFGNNASIADLQIAIESAPEPEEEANGVTVLGSLFQSVQNIGILRQVGAEQTGVTLLSNVFTPQTNGVGVAIQCGTAVTIQRNLTLAGNVFPASSSPTQFAYQTRYCNQADLEVGPTWVRAGSGLAVTRTPATESPLGTEPATQMQELSKVEATLDFAPVPGQTCLDLDLAAQGATTGDLITGLAVPQVAYVAGVFYTARLVVAGTVTVRACNLAATSSPDPGAGLFKVAITRFE